MRIGEKTLSDWLDERSTSRWRFTLALVVLAILAVLAGWFVSTQISLLIENLRWGADYDRVISYVFRIVVFGAVGLMLAFLPVVFVVLWIRKQFVQKSR